MQGSSKVLISLKAVSATRFCVSSTNAKYSIRTLSTASVGTDSSTTATTSNIGHNNSVIPKLPELHYKPETITIDAAMQALYAKLPRGEFWDRQPEDLRLMYGTDKESIVRICCNGCFAYNVGGI